MAIVNLYGEGSCAVYSSTVGMGQGSDTVLAQLAAEVLGLEARAVRIVHPDTDVKPYDMATLGSRSTYHMGNAVVRAAEEVRRQLTAIGAEIFRCRAEEVELRDGHLVAGGQQVSFKEAMEWRFGMQAGNLIGVGSFTPTYKKPDPNTGESEDITTFWMVGGNGVEVDVDPETGRVTVTKLVTVGDAGKALNPGLVRTQLSGAALKQLGFTRFEEMRFEEGQVVNASLADYKILGMRDLPSSVVAEFVEVGATHGPFGAKRIGEVGSLAVFPAVANAVFDAGGVRVTSLPLTPEKVLRALKEQAGEVWEEVE